MTLLRPPLLATLALSTVTAALALFGGSVAGCGDSATSDIFTPITGVTVRAETLTVGRGCGRGANQIFKYAAVVLGRNPTTFANDVVVASNLYDCFTDGTFIALPPSAGSFEYALQIYAYNAAAYEAAGDAVVRAAAANNPGSLKSTQPTFTTSCTAQQLDQVQVLAICAPLSVGGAGLDPTAPVTPAAVQVDTSSFRGADGGVLKCDDDYVFVQSRASTGTTTGAQTEGRCSVLDAAGLEPVPIVISPAAAPASYVVQIALLRADHTLVGETTCSAETSPGVTSKADCSKPIH